MNKNIFFITGMGRSGSKFLSDLLCLNSYIKTFHEFPKDKYMCTEAFYKRNMPMTISRLKLTVDHINQIQEINPNFKYIEVSSYLRYQTQYLKNVFDCKVIHLVRDCRKVVRSIMCRSAFTDKDIDHTGKIKFTIENWESLDRFEKVCIYWNDAVSFLLNNSDLTVRFEDLISSYESFNSSFLKPLELEFNDEIWKICHNKKVNETQLFTFPEYQDWTDEQKIIFNQHCMLTMHRLGYFNTEQEFLDDKTVNKKDN